ncbi:uncharacterized protein [Nothobranchius furzeri]|uniref:uncharacterized protein isoform X4 n=1 Tax=Nothobranchius furzeri TaxID=105023 RepID=UPI003904A20A
MRLCAPRDHAVDGKMESRKSKGGAEKARIKKRKALETDAAKCAKMSTFFSQTSLRSLTSNEDKTAPQSQTQDPVGLISTRQKPTIPERTCTVPSMKRLNKMCYHFRIADQQ